MVRNQPYQTAWRRPLLCMILGGHEMPTMATLQASQCLPLYFAKAFWHGRERKATLHVILSLRADREESFRTNHSFISGCIHKWASWAPI